MRILSKILRVITFIVVALFICGIDSIYDNCLSIWLLYILILLIGNYGINNKLKDNKNEKL